MHLIAIIRKIGFYYLTPKDALVVNYPIAELEIVYNGMTLSFSLYALFLS